MLVPCHLKGFLRAESGAETTAYAKRWITPDDVCDDRWFHAVILLSAKGR